MTYFRTGLLAMATSASLALAPQAQATTVDLELMLLTDASGSVDAADYALYIQGYAAAFRNASVIQAITDGPIGKIAVAVGFFSDSSALGTAWTVISDAASGEAFASAIEAMARPFSSGTGIAQGINFAAAQFGTNGFDSARQVIDVTIDGSESNQCSSFDPVCVPLQNARDAALAGGVDAINALLIQDRNFFGENPGDFIAAVAYANTNIIGGTGSFTSFVSDFSAFPKAIDAKILREIKPPPSAIPLPAAGWLMIAGLGGLAALRRRRKAA